MSEGKKPDTTPTDAEKSLSLLRATLESTADGVVVVDRSGALTIYNQRFADLWHIPPDLFREGSDAERRRYLIDQVKHPDSFFDPRPLWADSEAESFDIVECKDGRIFERYSRPQYIDGRSVGRVWSYRDVTERRRAEERLRESEERFRLIAENVGDLVAMLDIEGRRLYNSPSYRTLFRNRTLEKGSDSFSEVHPEDRDRMRTIFRQTVKTGMGQRAEFRFVLEDGSVRHIESEGRVIEDRHGAVTRVVVVSRDISERRRVEQRQQMEHGVTRVLAESESLAQAIPRIIQTVCDTLDWDCGARWMMDEGKRAVRCVETWHVDSAPVADFVANIRVTSLQPTNRGLVRQAWHSGSPKWITDVSADTQFQRGALAVRAGLHGAFAFPIRAGAVTLGVLEFFSREIRQPDEHLLQMVGVIGSQIGQFMARKQAEENLLYVATHDTLTGLPNRFMFNQRFAHALSQAQRHHKSMALLFLDLDRFKFINDTRGHPFGDQLLVDVAARLRTCLRESDTIARFGGDEFVAVLEDFTAPSDVVAVAQKILQAIRKPFLMQGDTAHLTASIGISLYPSDGHDLATLLKNADIANYRAKQQGKNTYLFYSEEMNVHLFALIALESKLRHALERNEFVLHYEPKVDVRNGRITGMEALIRWRHPELGLLRPAEFIGLAEDTGLIVPIGAWALRTGCCDAAALQRAGHTPLRLSVNLSARQFDDPDLLADIQGALSDSGLDPDCLELEITESMVMRDVDKSKRILDDIKAMGIRLAIDDFGTGYSSLASLKRFPIDSLKIDRSFIKDIPQDRDDMAITQAIIAMAHSLQLEVVAEGVETQEQLDFLHGHGCHHLQGHLFRKPQPVLEFAQLLREEVEATFGWRPSGASRPLF
jgi:diguanylate cyclase (GGDEF)-like protein/PAS domain S-box-containing protein